MWEYDKEAFWAYPEGQQPAGTSPIYHFWSPSLERHFYTIDLSERDEKREDDENWEELPVAWYAFDYIDGRIDDDCDVDLVDFSLFARCWRETGCEYRDRADATCDGDVDFSDLVSLCYNWLAGL